ncbi:hypothetical protein [Roseateles chitinivorans]|uniref:hypothetical protein n=1 Tax=Roseateles chitinivorans TaxID=2917965 RepID=UPI003D66A4DD
MNEFSGFVAENHVVVLERVKQSSDSESSISPETLLEVLRCEQVDRYFRCISGSTNVSVFELAQLPLPDPKKVAARRKKSLSITSDFLDLF